MRIPTRGPLPRLPGSRIAYSRRLKVDFPNMVDLLNDLVLI